MQHEPIIITWPIVSRRPHELMHSRWFREMCDSLFHRTDVLNICHIIYVWCFFWIWNIETRWCHPTMWNRTKQSFYSGHFLKLHYSLEESQTKQALSLELTLMHTAKVTRQACSNNQHHKSNLVFSANTTGWLQLLKKNKLTKKITWRHILMLPLTHVISRQTRQHHKAVLNGKATISRNRRPPLRTTDVITCN